MPKRSFYIEIFCVSLAAILLEIAYTRVFSFKVYYLFTYIIIGVGLSGLGSGGVLVAISKRLREADPARLIPTVATLGGASAGFGYLYIAQTQLNILLFTSHPIEILKLINVCFVLALPFLAAGILISAMLGWRPDISGRLYGADLMGAALGCAAAVPLLTTLNPPATILLASVIFTASGLKLALGSKKALLFTIAACAVLLIGLFNVKRFPEPSVDKSKGLDEYRRFGLIEFSKWNPVFRVDVSRHPIPELRGTTYILFHDGQPGAGIRAWDGKRGSLAYLDRDPRALPFSVVKDNPRVLIIGAAGGHEILASLYFRASHITGVELNPVTVSLLTDDDKYAGLTGRLSENKRVTLINGEGRSFLRRSHETYDLIWFVAADSYAAMNASSSGSYVLSESYLYTVEALKDSLDHLSDGGVICANFGEIDYRNRPNRTARYLGNARQAFLEKGITDFPRHVLVGSAMGYPPFDDSVLLLGKSAFNAKNILGFLNTLKGVTNSSPRYIPGRTEGSTAYDRAITLPDNELRDWYSGYPYQVGPVRDDSPFFWHFTGYVRALLSPPQQSVVIDFENGLGERTALFLFALITLIAAVMLLSPLVAIRRTWTAIPYKTRTAIYFASLGLGFMFIEVVLIQMFTLFLGYPTYSLSVTLFGMLVFSGAGSLLSESYKSRRNRALVTLLAALAVMLIVYPLALPVLFEHFIGTSLSLRIALATAFIAPLGLCLGAFLPIGVRTAASVAPQRPELIAWAWAVNGFFSVIASVLCTVLAMTIGFKLVLILALLIYAVGVFALRGIPEST
jgi:spermidine synthase